jgi:hypothetical protein
VAGAGGEHVPHELVPQPRGRAGDARGTRERVDEVDHDPQHDQTGGRVEPPRRAAADDRVDGLAEHQGQRERAERAQ